MASFIRRILRSLFIVWAISVAGAVVAPAQTPAPGKPPVQGQTQDPEEKLTIETNLVPLRVTVTDQQGRAIRELKVNKLWQS